MAILDVKNLSFSYDGKKQVFQELNIGMDKGQALCIVGPNGSGKSTFIDCLLGLNKPTSGEILIQGKNIREMKPAEMARHMAYVPQNHKTTFSYKVIDVVAMGRTHSTGLFSPPGEEDKEIALQALRRVGLEGFEDREYTKLSGGELQLVIIARALAQQAEILVMDEPTAHLDFTHELSVMETVASLITNEGLSVVMATHFLNQAYFLENSGVDTGVVLLNKGRFVKSGSPSTVLTEPVLEEHFNIVTEIVSSGSRKYILALHHK